MENFEECFQELLDYEEKLEEFVLSRCMRIWQNAFEDKILFTTFMIVNCLSLLDGRVSNFIIQNVFFFSLLGIKIYFTLKSDVYSSVKSIQEVICYTLDEMAECYYSEAKKKEFWKENKNTMEELKDNLDEILETLNTLE